eukprot:3121647-Pyramimonas_sp.AAC.1
MHRLLPPWQWPGRPLSAAPQVTELRSLLPQSLATRPNYRRRWGVLGQRGAPATNAAAANLSAP